MRLRLEAEAVLGILDLVESSSVDLISSTVLELETARNPLTIRREHGEQVLAAAKETVIISENLAERAGKLATQGLSAMDALHVAAAEFAHVNYFCTCDDQILRKAAEINDLQVKVVSPIELIEVL